MTAYNVVRFRVKAGREQDFVEGHRKADADFGGWRNGALVKTGDQTYCFVGEWNRFDDIVAARPKMIGMLDQFRDMLEDLGGGLGLTDPVSGEAVVQFGPKAKPAPRKAKAKKAAPKRAAKKPAKAAKKSKAKSKRGRRR